MNTVVNPTASQWIGATAQTIEDIFNSLKEQALNSIKFIHTHRFELALMAIVAFFVLFSVYVLFFAPPMPPCVDGYRQP